MPRMYGVSLPSDPSCVDERVGAVDVEDRRDDDDLVVEQVPALARAARSRATISSASAASGSGGWMLPNRKMTGLPDARACCADVTRGFDEHDRRRHLAHRADEHVDDVHVLALPLQRADELEELDRRHRAREPAALGDRLQLGGPLPVPACGHLVAPVDLLLCSHDGGAYGYCDHRADSTHGHRGNTTGRGCRTCRTT